MGVGHDTVAAGQADVGGGMRGEEAPSLQVPITAPESTLDARTRRARMR